MNESELGGAGAGLHGHSGPSRWRNGLAGRAGAIAAVGAVLLLLTGCNIIGALSAKAPRPDIDAAYKGFAGQTVGVMVWADRSTMLVDWPNLQLDLGNGVAAKLKSAQDAKAEEFVGTTFPFPPASYIRYQREHPGVDAQPIVEVAPKLRVSRLIYIEVNSFSTRVEGSVAMFLGQADVALTVLEINNGKAKVVYSDPHIRVKFPKSAPAEGEMNKSERVMYVGTVDSLCDEIALRFLRHPDDSK